jgi:hypothetical protein
METKLRRALVEHKIEIEQLKHANAKLQAKHDNFRDALLECEEWFDRFADCDCDQDGFIPNAEMKMLCMIREVL